MAVHDLLSQGIAAAKAGQREQARDLLMQAIELDERNEKAWLWLSGVVDTTEDRCVCLENVLALNPDNTWARRGLERLLPDPEPQAAPDADPVPPSPASLQPGRSLRARPRPEEPEEPKGFERLRDAQSKKLKPALILLAVILVPGILWVTLQVIPITWRAAINERLGISLLGVVSVDHNQSGRTGRLALTVAGPSLESRSCRGFKLSEGETVVFHYDVTAEQGYLGVQLERDDLSPFDPDFATSTSLPILVRATEEKIVTMRVSHSGQYRVTIYLWNFEGKVDVRWETR